MEMDPARPPARIDPSYHAVRPYDKYGPDWVSSDHARRLRRWGFAAGLAIVAVAVAFAWALSVLTTSATPSVWPSPAPSTTVVYMPIPYQVTSP